MIGEELHNRTGLIAQVTPRQLSKLMVLAIEDYEPMRRYIARVFNKDLTYIRGLCLDRDEHSENQYEDLPAITIDTVKWKLSEVTDKRYYVFGIQVKIVRKNEFFDPVVKDGNIHTYEGLDIVETINQMILEAIASCKQFQCMTFEEVEMLSEPVRFISNQTEYNGFMNLILSAESYHCIGAKWLVDTAVKRNGA